MSFFDEILGLCDTVAEALARNLEEYRRQQQIAELLRTGQYEAQFHIINGELFISFRPLAGAPDPNGFPPGAPGQRPPPPPPRPPRQVDGRRLALRALGFKTGENPDMPAISARFKDLARRYHPDVNKRGAERMKKLSAAYQFLKDEARSR